MKVFMCFKCGQPIFAKTLDDLFQIKGDYGIQCKDCKEEESEVKE